MAAWEKWNKLLVRQLKQGQAADGSFRSQMGGSGQYVAVAAALAVNFRFLPIWERRLRVTYAAYTTTEFHVLIKKTGLRSFVCRSRRVGLALRVERHL